MIPQSRESFRAGLQLYRDRPDKGYSPVDCISMQTMRREGLTEVLTNDRHFEQEGFRALSRDSRFPAFCSHVVRVNAELALEFRHEPVGATAADVMLTRKVFSEHDEFMVAEFPHPIGFHDVAKRIVLRRADRQAPGWRKRLFANRLADRKPIFHPAQLGNVFGRGDIPWSAPQGNPGIGDESFKVFLVVFLKPVQVFEDAKHLNAIARGEAKSVFDELEGAELGEFVKDAENRRSLLFLNQQIVQGRGDQQPEPTSTGAPPCTSGLISTRVHSERAIFASVAIGGPPSHYDYVFLSGKPATRASELRHRENRVSRRLPAFGPFVLYPDPVPDARFQDYPHRRNREITTLGPSQP